MCFARVLRVVYGMQWFLRLVTLCPVGVLIEEVLRVKM